MSLDLRTDERSANMGAVEEEEVESFARLVASELGCRWKWTTAGPIYIHPVMLIDRYIIGRYPWEAIEHVLHEGAHHVLHPYPGHGASFFRTYADLLKKFVVGVEE